MNRNTLKIALEVLLVLALTSCSALIGETPTEPSSVDDPVAASQTAEAQQAVAETPPIILSAVPEPSDTPAATPTLAPTFTPAATATIWTLPPPSPTAVFVFPTAKPVQVGPALPACDLVEVTDTSYPPGSDLAPMQEFDKSWKFKNIGSCTWTTGYSLVFVSGNDLSGSGSTSFPKSVAPGETIEMTVKMQAPNLMNNYIGNWMLRNADGKKFGVGPNGKDPFTVEIDVLGYMPVSYNFFERACEAKWTSGAGELPCPDTAASPDEKGVVQKILKPHLETGGIDNEPALLTQPQANIDGYITGKFPAYTVKAGEHFYVALLCQYGATLCDVTFTIEYMLEGTTSIVRLGTWNEKYDDSITYVDLDLTSLVGKSVIFLLSVEPNQTFQQAEALWLAPVIDKP